MPATPPSALSAEAFRRLQASLERAGAVFAELCGGDALAGDHAVAWAMRAQPAGAAVPAHTLAVRYWRTLLAAPDMRLGPLPALVGSLGHLGRLPPGLRVLVLLKVLSGLGEVELAAILARSPADCRHGLARARALAGEADWQAWPAALAMRAETLAPVRAVNIASWRSQLAQPPRWQDDARAQVEMSPRRRRALAGVVVATALALALSHAPWPWRVDGDATPRIRTRALAEQAPKARFDAATAIATHPDRALLLIPDADAMIARDTAFYAWYQAERLGTSSYEPPPPTLEAPESAASNADSGGADAP